MSSIKQEVEALRRKMIVNAAGLLVGVGTFYYVGSTSSRASNNNPGVQPERPLATLGTASAGGMSKVTASSGDVVVLLPGHTEALTAAAAAAITKAGTTVVGLGEGALKPTFNFTTATTADLDIDAANVRIINCRFVSGIDDLAAMIDVNADRVTFEDCEFVSTSTKECVCFVDIATTKDYFTFRRCRWEQPADPTATLGAASTGAIYCVDTEQVTVEDCTFNGFFETACLHNKTTAMKYLTWRRNTVNQQLNNAVRILTPVGTVGMSFGPDTDFIPGRGYPVKRATAAPPDASATTAYFNVNGAPVDLTSFNGECTTAFATGGGASSLKFQANPTATGSSVDLCAVLDVNTIVVGTLFGITGTLATALQNGHAVIAMTTPIRLPVGTIDATMATTTVASGSAKWHLTWMPIDYTLGVPNVVAV